MAPASRAASILWVMPPIEPTLPSPVMVPVPATNLRSVEVAGGELVDDREAEHQPGRRAADVGEVEVDGERRPRRVEHADAEIAVVAVGVGAQRDGGDAGRRVLAAVVDHDGLARFGVLQQRLELVQVGDRRAVDRVDGVAGLQLADRRTRGR